MQLGRASLTIVTVIAIVAILGAAVCVAVWNGVVESLRRGV